MNAAAAPQPMTDDQALAALTQLVIHSNKMARHTNADVALDVIRQALAQCEKMRSALKPFANVAEDPEFQGDDEYRPPDSMYIDPLLPLGAFRRAYAALHGLPTE